MLAYHHTPQDDQLIGEFGTSSQYVGVAIYFDGLVLPELNKFFYRQAGEERMHAMKIVHFLLETGYKPIMPATPEVRNDFDSAEDAVQLALDKERKVTEEINDLTQIAAEERDHATPSSLMKPWAALATALSKNIHAIFGR